MKYNNTAKSKYYPDIKLLKGIYNMKRLTGLLFIFIMSILLVACSKSDNNPQPTAAVEPSPQINASQNIEANASETASPEVTTSEETTSEADTSEADIIVQNNDSYFIGINGKVYFRVPTEYGMNNVALFDNFLCEMHGDTNLLSYDPQSSEIESIRYDTAAYGPMSRCGDFIFYENNSDSEGYGDYNLTCQGVDSDNDIPMDTNGQFYLCGSNDGEYFVAIKHNNETESDLFIYSSGQGGKNIGKYTVEDFYSGVGIAGDSFFYIACELNENNGWDYFLWSLDLINNKATKLGRLPEIESGPFPGEVNQFECDENGNVCFSYSCYEGTGHFLYSTFAIVAKANTENSLVSSQLSITEDESVPAFRLDISYPGYKITDGAPENAGFMNDQIGYFDSLGDFVPLADAKEWNWDYDTENAIVYEQYGYVYGDVYAIRDYLIRYPNMDIGWRQAFYREKVEVVKIDGTTGKEEVLTTVEPSPYMTLPITYDNILGKWKLHSFSVESDEMFLAEEMGEIETMDFNYDGYVNYSQNTRTGETVEAQYEVVDENNGIYFEFEQEFGPKTFNITGMNPDGYLVAQIHFYYNDGTTGSEYALYERAS